MILLDTHAFLWFESNDKRLPQKIQKRILEEDKVYISIASFWEIAIKNSLGKLKLSASVSALMDDCNDFDITILSIKASHLERLRKLEMIHRDPFDRLFICQALEENLTLITADENIKKYNVPTLWE